MTKKSRRRREQMQPTEPFPTTRKKVEVLPRTESQKTYIRTVHQSDITFAVGSAGTGKTHLAGLLAMWYLTEGHVDKIIVCRPAIEAGGEKLGHLPGKLEEKMDPFIRPVYDAFETYWHKQAIERRVSDGTIEIVPLAFMRGRTFKRSFIIADEMEDSTIEQMIMLLTRLGKGSKMIITGDPQQRNMYKDTLSESLEKIGHLKSIGTVIFRSSDTVRHPTVKSILNAWYPEKKRGIPDIVSINKGYTNGEYTDDFERNDDFGKRWEHRKVAGAAT